MKPVFKKAVPVLVLLAGLGAPALAQQGPPSPAAKAAGQQAAAYVQRLAPELGLTAEQLPRVRQIILTSRLEMAAAGQQARAGGDPAAVRPAMKAARDKAEAALRGVLSPAQYARYQQYVAARLGQLRTTSQTD